jgi:HD-GYP domain-containing protein (c-di-GMP phosphodiesterase class II)
MEHVLRQCLIALRIAERVGLGEPARATVYYTALLINVGCHTDAHEQAKWFGDDIAMKSTKYDHGLRSARSAIATFRRLGSGHRLVRRFRIGVEFAVGGHRDFDRMIEHHSTLACAFAGHLRMTGSVRDAVGAAYEQWDGKGWPGTLHGDDVPQAARIAQLAEFVEVAHRVGGVEAVRNLARKQRGRQFDPRLCDLLVDEGDLILADLDEVRTWDAVIDAEPALTVTLAGEEIDAALAAVADFIDLKSPYLLGHSGALAVLAGDAAVELGMSAADVRTVRRAALVSGFGRLGVSNSIWDKPGPLGAGEWERVRMHPYLTERMLHDSNALSPLGAVAAQIRERLDGSGYPRGLSATEIPRPDAYQAMREPRAHRPARSPDEAAAELRAEVTAGRLDADAVHAVLGVTGHRVPRRREGPAGLTPREIDVLRLAARGMTNRDIAAILVISPKTVSNHIERIYLKIGASNRAMASLFAMKHGLLPEEEPMRAAPPR